MVQGDRSIFEVVLLLEDIVFINIITDMDRLVIAIVLFMLPVIHMAINTDIYGVSQ